MPRRTRPVSRQVVAPYQPPPSTVTLSDEERKRREQAWRSVREFRNMVPGLTTFAKAVTGRNVKVKMSPNGGAYSSADEVFLSPPLALGRELTHTKNLCHKRTPGKRQQCKACEAREEVTFYLFHELGHVGGGTNVQPADFILQFLFELVDEWHPVAACSHGAVIKSKMRQARNYLGVCAQFDMILKVIWNALEDLRVDAGMFRARPGLKVSFEAGLIRVFDPEWQADQNFTPWSARPLLAQIVTGFLFVGADIPIGSGYFSVEAMEYLEDGELQTICSRAAKASDAHQLTTLVVAVFRRLVAMGVYELPKCEVPPPPPPPAPPQPQDEDSDEEQDEQHSTAQGSDEPPSEKEDADPGEGEGEGPGTPDQDPESTEGQDDDASRGDGSAGGESDSDDARESDGDGEGDPESEPGDSEDAPSGTADDAGNDESDESDSSPGDGSDSEESDPNAEGSPSGGDDLPSEEDDEGSTAGSADSESAGDSGQGGGDRGDAEGSDPSDGTADPQDGAQSSPDDEGDGQASPQDSSDEERGDAEQEDGEPEEGSDSSSPDPDSASDSPEPGEDVWDPKYNAPEDRPRPTNPGTAEDVIQALRELGAHMELEEGESETAANPNFLTGDEDSDDGRDAFDRETEELRGKDAVILAIVQSAVFDSSAQGVKGLEIITYPFHGGEFGVNWPFTPDRLVTPEDLQIPAAVVNKSVMKARLVFDENRRSKSAHDLKAGRVDPRVLGRRAAVGDERLFRKRTRPGLRDWFVAMGLDGSGSTGSNFRCERIQRAAYSQAELLHRVGVPFSIYVQTGGNDKKHFWNYQTPSIWMLEVKRATDPWNAKAKERLLNYGRMAENYDGHNLEFLRKQCDASTATDKVIIYYTDGEMPAANEDEELEVLERELKICKERGYTVLAVGINTDSPTKYGLPTVRVDSDSDLEKVIIQLGKRLTS